MGARHRLHHDVLHAPCGYAAMGAWECVGKARCGPPCRAGSSPSVHCYPAVPLALTIRTRTLNRDADQRPAVVVPIGMFAREAAIIVDERFQRLR